MVDACAHDRFQVAKHPATVCAATRRSGRCHGEAEVSAPRDRLEDLSGLLLRPLMAIISSSSC